MAQVKYQTLYNQVKLLISIWIPTKTRVKYLTYFLMLFLWYGLPVLRSLSWGTFRRQVSALGSLSPVSRSGQLGPDHYRVVRPNCIKLDVNPRQISEVPVVPGINTRTSESCHNCNSLAYCLWSSEKTMRHFTALFWYTRHTMLSLPLCRIYRCYV